MSSGENEPKYFLFIKWLPGRVTKRQTCFPANVGGTCNSARTSPRCAQPQSPVLLQNVHAANSESTNSEWCNISAGQLRLRRMRRITPNYAELRRMRRIDAELRRMRRINAKLRRIGSVPARAAPGLSDRQGRGCNITLFFS